MTDAITALEEEERRSGWRTIKKVAPYLWTDEHPWVKRRVLLSMMALILAKVISVSTPFFYKAAVDNLGGHGKLHFLQS